MPDGAPIYVAGDVHGQFAKLRKLLRSAGLMGKDSSWTGGEATLWFMGDFFDRGPGGLRAVDLVMRLQEEAALAGGRVESLLGNHEVVLLGAYRFADLPTTGQGKTFLKDWVITEGYPADLKGLTDRHIEWIVNLPAMAHVGEKLFLHADAEFYKSYGNSVDEVNAAFRSLLRSDDHEKWDLLLGQFAERLTFSDRRPEGKKRAREMLRRFGGTQMVHGHTPIPGVTGAPPEEVREPLVYAGGLCVNVDGGMYMGGQGFVWRLPVTSDRGR
jgi:hypothetical protein